MYGNGNNSTKKDQGGKKTRGMKTTSFHTNSSPETQPAVTGQVLMTLESGMKEYLGTKKTTSKNYDDVYKITGTKNHKKRQHEKNPLSFPSPPLGQK